jgi:hypothetical protein
MRSPAIPSGAVGLQYTDSGSYDLSLIADHWPGVDPVQPLQEVTMQDALYAVDPAPDGSSPGIWFYADGRYTHVGNIAQRDLIVAQFGVQQKPLPYAAHQVLLALTAPATLTLTDAQAQAIAAGVKFPTGITLTGKLS